MTFPRSISFKKRDDETSSLLSVTVAAFLWACLTAVLPAQNAIQPPTTQQFNDYWYSGEAELTRFDLRQARYGAIHTEDARAVQIYVTEDLLEKEQVKADDWRDPGTVKVLKLNNLREFNTGLYQYSLMTSVFTPVNTAQHPRTLKLTTSVQDWCGQTFTQLNLKNRRYNVLLRSYFESEGDEEWRIDAVPLEDELFTRIRLDPTKLPTGNITIIPAMRFFRFTHQRVEPKKARAELELVDKSDFSDQPHAAYELAYDGIDRKIAIYFERQFPYPILGWIETGSDPDRDLTTAHRTHTLKIDYWTRNQPDDARLRKELGLE
jgi:hypothetical protein